MRSLYARLLAAAASRHAPLYLFATAFAEASFFPLPPDALLVPMVLARPRAAWWLAALCTAGSVTGGLFGYWIGATFFRVLALPLLRLYHMDAGFDAFARCFAHYGFWFIMVKGLTPIPFKLVTIASGAAHFALGPFVVACTLTRGGRFLLLEAVPLRLFGERARIFIERRLGLVLTGVLVLAVLGLLAIRLFGGGGLAACA